MACSLLPALLDSPSLPPHLVAYIHDSAWHWEARDGTNYHGACHSDCSHYAGLQQASYYEGFQYFSKEFTAMTPYGFLLALSFNSPHLPNILKRHHLGTIPVAQGSALWSGIQGNKAHWKRWYCKVLLVEGAELPHCSLRLLRNGTTFLEQIPSIDFCSSNPNLSVISTFFFSSTLSHQPAFASTLKPHVSRLVKEGHCSTMPCLCSLFHTLKLLGGLISR